MFRSTSKNLLRAIVLGLLFLSTLMPVRAADLPGDVSISVMDNMRHASVRIASTVSSIRINTEESSLVVRAGEEIELYISGTGIEARVDGRRFSSSQIQLVASPGAPIRLVSGAEAREYAGSLVVSNERGNLKVVNRVPLEDYVASVIGSEYGFKDLEGSKAMAVVARTYALHAIQNGKELLDNERFQVYRGLSHATAIARQAAAETAGQVLSYDNKLIEAVYSASNGGITATNSSVWGTRALPYLQSRKDKWDTKSPYANWDWKVDSDDLFRALSSDFNLSVKDIKVGKPGADGRVEDVELKGSNGSKSVSGSAFRAAVARHFGAKSLRSTYFSAKERRGTFTFSGQGFGHGVGLSQWGAHYMSRDGRSYSQILEFYYSNTQLEHLPSSGSSDQSLIELPVLSSGSSVSASANSASLKKVSGETSTPKEKSSTIFSAENTTVLGAEADLSNIWNTPNKAGSSDKPAKKKPSRRAGW